MLACAVPAAIAAQAQRPRLMRALAAALVVAVAAGGLAGRARFSRAAFWDTGAALGRFLDAAPPRARVVTSDFQTIFALWYLAAAEARRPDVEVVHRHFLAYPGYREEIARRVGDVSREPNVVEYDLDLPDALVARASTIAVADGADLAEPQTLRYAAWQAYLGADRACRLGGGAAAEPALSARARVAVAAVAKLRSHSRSSYDQRSMKPLPLKAVEVSSLPARKPMARAARVTLFEREVREKLSVAAIEILARARAHPVRGAALGGADGEARATSARPCSPSTSPRSATLVREACDARAATRVAELIRGDARVTRRVQKIAAREARAARRRTDPRARRRSARARAGTLVYLDVDVEE